MRLLLLEDSPAEYENLLVWLRPHFQIDHVTSVAGVRKLLAGNRYDVGLIDLCVDDSRDLATFLTVRELAPELPVVVQSGLQEDAIALEAVARGAQDYLVKRSFTAELVRRALRYAMERAGAERELRESRERYQLALEGARDGIWEAIGRGAFGDIKRTRTGGKGFAGVVAREAGYVNPILEALEH